MYCTETKQAFPGNMDEIIQCQLELVGSKACTHCVTLTTLKKPEAHVHISNIYLCIASYQGHIAHPSRAYMVLVLCWHSDPAGLDRLPSVANAPFSDTSNTFCNLPNGL